MAKNRQSSEEGKGSPRRDDAGGKRDAEWRRDEDFKIIPHYYCCTSHQMKVGYALKCSEPPRFSGHNCNEPFKVNFTSNLEVRCRTLHISQSPRATADLRFKRKTRLILSLSSAATAAVRRRQIPEIPAMNWWFGDGDGNDNGDNTTDDKPRLVLSPREGGREAGSNLRILQC